MSSEENKRLIRHFFAGVNARDMGAFEVFAPDAVHHNPFPGTTPGREGNKQGMMLLFAATGKQVTVAGIAIFRLRNGQIVEEWLITDQLGAMQHIGGIEGGRQTP